MILPPVPVIGTFDNDVGKVDVEFEYLKNPVGLYPGATS